MRPGNAQRRQVLTGVTIRAHGEAAAPQIKNVTRSGAAKGIFSALAAIVLVLAFCLPVSAASASEGTSVPVVASNPDASSIAPLNLVDPELASAAGQTLKNTVTGSAKLPGGNAASVIPASVDAEHPMSEPAFMLEQSVDPQSGSAVRPGDVMRYQVAGVNNGETRLEPVVIDVDLIDLNAYTTLVDRPYATTDGYWTAGDLQVDFEAGVMVWTGVLEPGETIMIVYTVQVDRDAAGATVKSAVVGSAQPLGSGAQLLELTAPPTPNPVAGFTLVSASDPAGGAAVMEGQRLVYTLTGVNNGATRLDPVTIADDVSGLNGGVTYNDDATALINGAPDATGQLSTDFEAGTPAGLQPIVPDAQRLEHPVAGIALVKDSDPASDTGVTPGQKITYTLIGTNAGATELTSVEILDDLSGISDWVTYNDDAVATIDGVASGGTLEVDFDDAKQLSWTSALQAGETVTITYSVTVNDDALGQTLETVATASALLPGPNAQAIIPAPSVTEHPVAGFELEKLADPPSGTAVNPGDVITCTVTASNTGAAVLDPVIIEDDLSGLMGHVSFNDDASVTLDGGVTAGHLDVQYDQGSLTWTGVLAPDQSVTFTYSATVTPDAAGARLSSAVEAEAYLSGESLPIVSKQLTTVHPVPAPGFALAKSSDPANGDQVEPGDTITYTLTGTNTGETVLEPVVITDDLSGVVDHAQYADDAFATIDGRTAAGDLAFDRRTGELVWQDALGVGEEVTITYSVTVDADAGGRTLRSTAVGTAQPPAEHPLIETPRIDVENLVSSQLATTGGQMPAGWISVSALLLVIVGTVIVTRHRRRVSSPMTM